MIVLVTGSRSFTNDVMVWKVLEGINDSIDGPLKIISGGATGPDSYAIDFAVLNELDWECSLPVWELGRDQGFMRNSFMCEKLAKAKDDGESVLVVAFWDEKSNGTKHTIDYARRLGIPTEVWN